MNFFESFAITTPSRFAGNPARCFALVFCLALAVRVTATATFVGLNSPPDAEAGGLDVVDYEGFAWSMASGDGYALQTGELTARRTPGTSFAILMPYGLFGRANWAAHLWFCLLSAATCVATGLLTNSLFGLRAGLLAAVGLTFYPGHVQASMHFFSEVPYAFAITVGSWLSVVSIASSQRVRTFASGIFWGIATLIRPNALLVFPAQCVLSLFLTREQRRCVLRLAAIQCVVALVVIAPWVYRNHSIFGKATIATVVGGYTFWGANNEFVLNNPEYSGFWVFGKEVVDAAHPLVGSEVEREQQAWGYGLDFVKSHAADMPALTFRKLQRFFSPFERTGNRTIYWAYAIAWIVCGPLVVAGVWLSLRSLSAEVIIAQSPLWMTLLTVVVFYGCIRFRDGIIPVLMPFAALAIVTAERRIRSWANGSI